MGWKMWLPHPQPHCQGRSCRRHGDEGRCTAHWGPGRRSAGCRCHGERPVQGDGQWIRAGLKAERWGQRQAGKVSRSVTILKVRSLDLGVRTQGLLNCQGTHGRFLSLSLPMLCKDMYLRLGGGDDNIRPGRGGAAPRAGQPEPRESTCWRRVSAGKGKESRVTYQEPSLLRLAQGQGVMQVMETTLH